MGVRSGRQRCIESWSSTPLPVEWGLVGLDVPGLYFYMHACKCQLFTDGRQP